MDRLWRHPSELGPRVNAPTARPRLGGRIGLALAATGIAATIVLGVALTTQTSSSPGRQLLTLRPASSVPQTEGTVTIDTDDGRRTTGMAVGEGIVLTSLAALASTRVVRVNGTPATLVATDPATDVAAIRTDLVLTPAVLAATNAPQTGDRIMLATRTATAEGYIVDTDLSAGDPSTNGSSLGLARTTILAQGTHAGAPVLDDRGTVVALTSGLTRNGYALVIPIGTARTVLDQLRRSGTIQHGAIGALIADTDNGVRILSVTGGGPADQAGLRADDRLTSLDGQPARSADAVAARIRDAVPGSRISLEIQRAGARLTVAVTTTAA